MKNSPGADKGTSFFLPVTKNKKVNKSFFRAIRKIREVSLPASVTVEASLVLPIFIFFFANIMVMFNIIKVQSDLEAALHQTGNEIAVRAFDVSFAEISSAFTKFSAFLESVMLKFAKMLEVAIVVPP